jgi:hypothetical protein
MDFDSKAHVVDYINNVHPGLAKKMSILQMGLFITNWKWGQASVPWERVCYTSIYSYLQEHPL